MSKFYKKLSIIFVMALAIMLGSFTNVLAADNFEIGVSNLNNTLENSAKVGNQLLHPEKGWKRYDDIDSNINYVGNWGITTTDPNTYKGTGHYVANPTNSNTYSIQFNFIGTKIRLIDLYWTNRVKNVIVNLDGVIYTYNPCNSIDLYKVVIFEKTGLSNDKHSIKITTDQTSGTFSLDAIDIDETGKLLPYDYTTLTATSSTTNQAITLNWDKVDGATGYNVKRSTTQGSGYEIMASGVKETTYDDKTVEPGTTYYYVVTPIINGKEGTQSNEASATANKPTETGNAILTITMTNGNVKSYTVSMTKVNDFISWYNNRSSGSNGSPYYAFDKTDNLQPFIKKTEYIVFDKISSFEVDEYSK